MSQDGSFEHVIEQIGQMRTLALALQSALMADPETPSKGDIPGALAIAVERAVDDLQRLYEAYQGPAA